MRVVRPGAVSPARVSAGGAGGAGYRAGVAAYDFSAPVWIWRGDSAWHFLTVPADVSDEIDELTTGRAGGFGSVRVEVTIGGTTWRTSLFPSKEAGAFILPVKKAVRQAEGCESGLVAEVSLRLL